MRAASELRLYSIQKPCINANSGYFRYLIEFPSYIHFIQKESDEILII
jgi:hypothetical protein